MKLDFNEVRRCRIPLHEALLAELKDANLTDAFALFDEIIRHDLENSRKLIKDNELLKKIFETLKEAESAPREEGLESLLQLARQIMSFEKSKNRFEWLVEMITLRVLAMIKIYEFDGTRIDASAQFFYGMFLSDSQEKYREAISYLETAFETCFRIDDWMFEVEPGVKSVQLFVLVSNQLCRSLLILAEKVQEDNPDESLGLATLSLRIVRENQSDFDQKIEVDSEIAIGKSLQVKGETDKALLHFDHALELAMFNKFYKKAYKIYLLKSECFEVLKNDSKYEETLTEAKNLAKVHLKSAVESEVLLTLGKYYVKRENYEKAYKYFRKAMKIFEESGMKMKLQEVKFLLAPLEGKICKIFFFFLWLQLWLFQLKKPLITSLTQSWWVTKLLLVAIPTLKIFYFGVIEKRRFQNPTSKMPLNSSSNIAIRTKLLEFLEKLFRSV